MTNHTSRGQQRDKPFRDALRMEEKELAAGAVLDHPVGSLRWNAQRLLTNGEVQGVRELADRLDGKPAQAMIGGDDDEPAIKADVTIRRLIVEPEGTK